MFFISCDIRPGTLLQYCSFCIKSDSIYISVLLFCVCDYRWAEISLLLRKPILQEEDMLYTVAAAEAGLMYTEEVMHVIILSVCVG